MANRETYRWIRDLHLYVGLFLSPFVVVFGLSVFFLNHTWVPWGGQDSGEPQTKTIALSIPQEDDNLALAKGIQRQLDIPGEIDFINRNVEEARLSFPITRPGHRTMVRLDLTTGRAELEQQETGIWDAMVYLHKMPGPHNVAVRGNWFYTRLWGWLADGTVYLLMFLTMSGIYLWLVLKAERKAGLFFVGTGAISLFALLYLIVG